MFGVSAGGLDPSRNLDTSEWWVLADFHRCSGLGASPQVCDFDEHENNSHVHAFEERLMCKAPTNA